MNEIHSLIAIASENITIEMSRKRVTNQTIYKKTGVSVPTISSIRRDITGTRNPKIETLLAIWVTGLGMDALDLFKK